MRRAVFALLFVALLTSISTAQKSKSWTELSKNDAEKLLNDSAWGQTQTETDTSEMFFSPTRPGTSSIGQSSATRSTASNQQSINNNRADRGAINQAISVNYRIRFFSAKPIREAISRMIVLNQDKPNEGLVEQMQTFVDRDFSQYIVVIVTFDSTDARFSGPALQAFGSATADTLKNKTYLERKDGKRLFLMDYRAPIGDGLGAKFVFPRMVDGKPFLDETSGNVRFVSDVADKIKLNVKYKISDMMYDGKLEY
jgi:hypothetical protein